jgi:hypothetical protein
MHVIASQKKSRGLAMGESQAIFVPESGIKSLRRDALVRAELKVFIVQLRDH